MNDFLMARMQALQDAEAKKNAPILAVNKPKGAAWTKRFVEAAKGKAVALPDGAYYLETKAGTGASPSKTALIKANYRGTFEDGTEFDSSYKRGEPTQFSLAAVVGCWTNGFPLMKIGGKAEIMCPSDSAYKDPGREGITPGVALHFDVELVEIVADSATAAPKK